MRWMRAMRVCGAAVLLAACREKEAPKAVEEGPPPLREQVVGRWRGANDQVELFAGGRMLLHQGPYRVAGTYEFVEPARVLLIYQNALPAAPPGDYRVALRADTLTFCETDSPARCVRYARLTGADSAGRGAADSARARPADDGTEPRLAAPVRPDQYPPEARSMEAHGVLKQAYTLQKSYQAMHGRYAATLEELRQVGWEPQPLRHFEPPVLAGTGERLCIVARPRAADLWPLHIGEDGKIERGARCR